jgi:DNA-directed RNA polymerase subunit RPC12/RpoP
LGRKEKLKEIIMTKKQRILFSDLTFGSKNVILEDAEITSELTEIAAKRGIVLPTPDIKLFKTVFAMADEENLNGCTLPYEEVSKALSTLVGKAVDLEHYRKETVGTWLDAKMEGNVIVAYGTLWASNYEEEATEILEDFKSGNLTVSFEAWGVRENTGPFSYKLKDIHFCGGALLRHHTQPACPQAFVQEFSEKGTKVLEFAKVMKGDEIKEESSFECECIECGHTVTSEQHCKDVKCEKCGGQMRRKDRPGPGTAEDLNNKAIDDKTKDKERAEELKKLQEEKEKESAEIMDEIKKLQEEIAELKVKLESVEGEKSSLTTEKDELTAKVEELNAQLEEVKESAEALKKDKEEVDAKLAEYVKVEEEAKKAAQDELVKSRREELAVDESVSDEDLLDEAKYELMKVKKEAEEAKAELEKMKKTLELSGKKDKEDNLPDWKKRQMRVDELTKNIK